MKEQKRLKSQTKYKKKAKETTKKIRILKESRARNNKKGMVDETVGA